MIVFFQEGYSKYHSFAFRVNSAEEKQVPFESGLRESLVNKHDVSIDLVIPLHLLSLIEQINHSTLTVLSPSCVIFNGRGFNCFHINEFLKQHAKVLGLPHSQIVFVLISSLVRSSWTLLAPNLSWIKWVEFIKASL